MTTTKIIWIVVITLYAVNFVMMAQKFKALCKIASGTLSVEDSEGLDQEFVDNMNDGAKISPKYVTLGLAIVTALMAMIPIAPITRSISYIYNTIDSMKAKKFCKESLNILGPMLMECIENRDVDFMDKIAVGMTDDMKRVVDQEIDKLKDSWKKGQEVTPKAFADQVISELKRRGVI